METRPQLNKEETMLFTGKIKSAVAGGGRNRYNKDSVFLSLDIEETTGGQYADNRNQRNMDSTLCKIIIG